MKNLIHSIEEITGLLDETARKEVLAYAAKKIISWRVIISLIPLEKYEKSDEVVVLGNKIKQIFVVHGISVTTNDKEALKALSREIKVVAKPKKPTPKIIAIVPWNLGFGKKIIYSK